MAGKYTIRSKEEKLAIVKRNLSGEAAKVLAREIGCNDRQVRDWVKIYLAEGEAGLEPKKKPGNPLSRYERRKELTYEEQLQYQIELLKRELVKKEAEVLRLKNGTNEKGAMPEKDDSGNVCRNSKTNGSALCQRAVQHLRGVSQRIL